jgi:hypothetical protein
MEICVAERKSTDYVGDGLLRINGQVIEHRGKWLKIGRVHDELWQPRQSIDDPEKVIAALSQGFAGTDIFTFAQCIPETEPKFRYYMEWDNWAVAKTSDFKKWWESMPQESRKNVRRAERRGLTTRSITLTEEVVRGIKQIYDETPIRQGRRFWHYQKDIATVKTENSSYLDRSELLGAFHGEELIGFLKMVFSGQTARIMQILAMNSHADKRPTNALLAKAVECCSHRGITHLIYGQYVYGKKNNSQVTEFKRRNGFEQVLLPRYYIPLTAKGKIALATGLHRELKERLPAKLLTFLMKIRLLFYRRYLEAE